MADTFLSTHSIDSGRPFINTTTTGFLWQPVLLSILPCTRQIQLGTASRFATHQSFSPTTAITISLLEANFTASLNPDLSSPSKSQPRAYPTFVLLPPILFFMPCNTVVTWRSSLLLSTSPAVRSDYRPADLPRQWNGHFCQR